MKLKNRCEQLAQGWVLSGTKIHVHAIKLRKYYTRVQQVLCLVPPLQCQTAVIYEKDDDFGDIIVPDMAQSISQPPLPSQRIDPSLLSHLDFQQRETLRYPRISGAYPHLP